MTYQELDTKINMMIDNLKNFFGFKIKYVYFCYFFDYSKINEKKIKIMCNMLDGNNIKYIFYNINTSPYYDVTKKIFAISKIQ